jgi:hypothetical protein
MLRSQSVAQRLLTWMREVRSVSGVDGDEVVARVTRVRLVRLNALAEQAPEHEEVGALLLQLRVVGAARSCPAPYRVEGPLLLVLTEGALRDRCGGQEREERHENR